MMNDKFNHILAFSYYLSSFVYHSENKLYGIYKFVHYSEQAEKPILLLFSAKRFLEFSRASGEKEVHDTAEKGKREKIGGEEEKKDEKED